MNDEDVKRAMIARYDAEAEGHDTEDWMESGSSARVPESRAAHYFIDRKVRMALSLSAPQRNWRAHEIGCSFGHMTSLLAREFDHLTASDISPRSVDIAQRRLVRHGIGNVNVVTADAEVLDGFEEAAFDVTYSFSTIRFCPHPDRALAAIRRTLAPGGGSWSISRTGIPRGTCSSKQSQASAGTITTICTRSVRPSVLCGRRASSMSGPWNSSSPPSACRTPSFPCSASPTGCWSGRPCAVWRAS